MSAIIAVIGISALLIAYYVRQQLGHVHRRRLYAQKTALSGDARKRVLEKHMQIRSLCADIRTNAKAHIKVADIMTGGVTAVRDDTPVPEVIERMRSQHTRHLIVLDSAGRPVGVVSDRDVFRDGNTAREIMAANPVTVASTSLIGNAVALLLSKRISCLPVVDEDGMCGIVTTTDMLMVLDGLLEHFEQHRRDDATAAPETGQEKTLQTMIA